MLKKLASFHQNARRLKVSGLEVTKQQKSRMALTTFLIYHNMQMHDFLRFI